MEHAAMNNQMITELMFATHFTSPGKRKKKKKKKKEKKKGGGGGGSYRLRSFS